MNANPVLLQLKYARIVAILAIMIFVIVKNVKSVRVQKNSMKHKGKDNKN